MSIKKLKNRFWFDIFYVLLIFLIINFTFQSTTIAQNSNQGQPNNIDEHFSLVLPLDPKGGATVNYAFQQGNLLAIVYGKSNLKVIDLDTEKIVYEISSSKSNIFLPYLVDNYLLYYLSGQKETIRIDLSTTEKESISFPGSSYQITDDGYLITHYGNLCQLIDLGDGQVFSIPNVSKSGRGKILCVDDVIIFPFVDSQGNGAGYKALSTTTGDLKFTLEEIFNGVRIFLPDYRSKISTFPIPILFCSNYNNPNKKQWLLKFINKEGQTIASYSPTDLSIDYSWNRVNSPLWVLDENQDNFLLQISSWKKEESQTKFYYVLTDLSGNVLQVFDEKSNCTAAIDSQGNILLHQVDGPSHILKYYQQNGTLIFSEQIPSLLEVNAPTKFKFLSENEILEWEYGRFEKYSLDNGELTGIYPISTNYQIYTSKTITYNNKVYFFAKPRGGHEPNILGTNLFSFSAADFGWLDIELVSIRPNAGTRYEVWDSTEVKVKFRTEYGSSFGENLSVNFEKGEVLAANDRNLEYTWHTPTIVSGSQDTVRITVSYGPVSQEFIIIIKDHLPTASFTFNPSSAQTEQNVHFDGSLSADLDGEISVYHWDFGDGTVELKQEQDYIDHIFSTAGEYLVTLTITDNNGQTAQISQNIKVTVAPKPPVADFKLLDPSPQWDTRVRFDASFSNDPDGTILSYRWDFGDGKTGKGINVTHQFPKIGGFIAGQGNYEVKLTVTDDHSLSSSKIIPITVGHILSYKKKGRVGIPAALRNKDDRIAEYQIEIITGDEPEAGTDSFVYLALYGPDGENGRLGSGELHPYDALDCYGTFEKGNTDCFTQKGYYLEDVEFMTLRHNNSYDAPAWYVKEIKITNLDNEKEWVFVPDQWLAMDKPPEQQVWIKLFPVEKPIAEFTYSPEEPLIGESITFDASLSQDPNGRIVAYSWDFEEAKGSNTAMIFDHQFKKEGVQKVSLTVTDDEGISATTTKYIDIKKNLIGRVESIIEWAWDSPVKIDFPYSVRDTIHVLEIGRSTNPYFHVDWKIKDNSSTIGHPLYVSSELAMYDFILWGWITGETEGHSKTGSDSRWEKYSRSGTWCLNPLQSSPVTKYKLILTGKSCEESKTESEIFYASLPLPQDLNSISPTVKTAASHWIAGRYELALFFRTMSQHWNNIKNKSLSKINYRKDTERILGSTHCLFGSTDAIGIVQNLGLDFLEVAANVAGSSALSGVSAVAGPLNIAYTYITWAIDSLSLSVDRWENIINEYSISQMGNTNSANELKISLEALFPAILNEANEAVEIVYNNDSFNEWYIKLQTEKNKLNDVAVKAASAYDDANYIFSADGTSDTEEDVLELLELIKEMANFQAGILSGVLPD